VVYSQLLTRQGYLWEHYEKLRDKNPTGEPQAWPNSLINGNSAERIRMLKLMRLVCRNNTTGSFTEADMQKWVFTSLHEETDLTTGWFYTSLFGEGTGDRLFRDTINSEKATRIVIALQQYRRRHGAFPDSLNKLQELGIEPDALLECEGGEQFGYALQGWESASGY
jgi:hypothetical protein